MSGRLEAVVELFGHSTANGRVDWKQIVRDAACPFLGKNCTKRRKSDPTTALGTCTISRGDSGSPLVICPARLIDRGRVFADCVSWLRGLRKSWDLHLVPEVTVPGGHVDFVLAAMAGHDVKDFIGIELQALDTTGTLWPSRQRILRTLGGLRNEAPLPPDGAYGINWKMTAKTILMQMHHKAATFEHVGRKLVLVIQAELLDYMKKEFRFEHLNSPPAADDSLIVHSYGFRATERPPSHTLVPAEQWGTNAEGVARCLSLQAEARVELDVIVSSLKKKISQKTLWRPTRGR